MEASLEQADKTVVQKLPGPGSLQTWLSWEVPSRYELALPSAAKDRVETGGGTLSLLLLGSGKSSPSSKPFNTGHLTPSPTEAHPWPPAVQNRGFRTKLGDSFEEWTFE